MATQESLNGLAVPETDDSNLEQLVELTYAWLPNATKPVRVEPMKSEGELFVVTTEIPDPPKPGEVPKEPNVTLHPISIKVEGVQPTPHDIIETAEEVACVEIPDGRVLLSVRAQEIEVEPTLPRFEKVDLPNIPLQDTWNRVRQEVYEESAVTQKGLKNWRRRRETREPNIDRSVEL